MGGLVGTIGIGFLATAAAPAGVDGLFYGGGLDQLWRQVIGAATVLVVSFVGTLAIALLLHRTMGFRIDEDDEVSGIDLAVHAETGYDLHVTGTGRSGVLSGALAAAASADTPSSVDGKKVTA